MAEDSQGTDPTGEGGFDPDLAAANFEMLYRNGEPMSGADSRFRDACPGHKDYADQWLKVPEEKAFDMFHGSLETLGTDILPFLYFSLKDIYPKVAEHVQQDWPAVETVAREIEIGRS